jgi:hypothetical protein
MRRLVVGVVLALAVAGCGGDPKADPTPTPSPPSSSSTTPAAPVMPEAAKANTKAGAVAFVKYYIEVFNHAQKTGATRTLASLSSKRCTDCQAAIRGLEQIYASGGHIDGGSLNAGGSTAEHNTVEDYWLVLVRVTSGPQSVASSSTTSPTRLPGGVRSMRFRLVRSHNFWKVTSWSRV